MVLVVGSGDVVLVVDRDVGLEGAQAALVACLQNKEKQGVGRHVVG